MKKIWDYIKNKVYDYFHPSIYDCIDAFGIVEKPITPEEAEKCRQLLKEWEDDNVENCGK